MNRALIGGGGHAKEVMDQMSETLIRFVDDEFYDGSDPMILPLSSFNPKEYEVMIAIGDSVDRMNMLSRLPENTKFFSFIHPTTLIMSDTVFIGEGSFLGAYSILTCDIQIGKHAILNRGNQVGHDSVIGDFFSGMPGAIVSGNVSIGNAVYMGTNSSVIEAVSICSNVVIGAQGCVVSNITEEGVYVGVPTKKNI
jgi:sugar O-acyltransferase (sialic acid O-acetyltransferase NeuD family)